MHPNSLLYIQDQDPSTLPSSIPNVRLLVLAVFGEVLSSEGPIKAVILRLFNPKTQEKRKMFDGALVPSLIFDDLYITPILASVLSSNGKIGNNMQISNTKGQAWNRCFAYGSWAIAKDNMLWVSQAKKERGQGEVTCTE